MVSPITVAELDRRLAANRPLLVEALSEDFHASGHLPGAVNFPLSSSDADLVAELSRHERSTIVVYGSRDGGEAVELAARLIRLGHHDVSVLAGGKEAWVEAGHVLERLPGG